MMVVYIKFIFSESRGTYTSFVYDLSSLESTEVVQKAVLQFEHDSNYKLGKELNVSVFSLAKSGRSINYLGSASMYRTLDLYKTLGSEFLAGLEQLIVQAKVPEISNLGLVLYSTTTSTFPNGHELAAFLFETTNQRFRRSVMDNEIDVKQFTSKDESKKKKKKKKVSRVNKLKVK